MRSAWYHTLPGAPVLDRSGYRAKTVSIVSVASELDGKPVAVGMELPDVVDALKAALRRGEATSEVALSTPDTAAKRIVVGGGTGIGTGTGAKFVSP